MKTNFFGLSFFYCFFDTADLLSYCGYFGNLPAMLFNLGNACSSDQTTEAL